MIVEHDRQRLQQLDGNLTERGYTVVSMTRALAQLPRLASALRPCAILLAWGSEGVDNLVREFDDNTCHVDAMIPILVFSRTGGTFPPPARSNRRQMLVWSASSKRPPRSSSDPYAHALRHASFLGRIRRFVATTTTPSPPWTSSLSRQ